MTQNVILLTMLETTDAKFKGSQVIIYGVKEDDDTLGESDELRIQKIIEETKAFQNETVGTIQSRRIGTSPSQPGDPPRALHVTLENPVQQRKLLDNAKNLGSVDGFKKIYIKKDRHPTVRFEQNRLRKKEKEEKAKPENQGRIIRYDHKKRVLLKDDVVIDRFCPSFR